MICGEHEGELVKVFEWVHTQQSAARAFVHAVGVFVATAQVALNGLLDDVVFLLGFGNWPHRDVAVRTFAGAVIAAHAVFIDLHFAIGMAGDGSGWATDHAFWVPAVAARGWN